MKTEKTILASIFTLLFSSASGAQEVAIPTAAEDASIEKISVTASRLNSRPGYDSPTPTTTLDAGFVNEMANINVADALNKLPSMGSATSPRTSANGVGSGTQGANFLNLRGLGSNRTLVLIDGRRVVGATPTGEVDINMLPSSLLKRTDIVTGGASAAWGSDAVAGVVNFILDNDYVGLKGGIQGGQSGYQDAEEFSADLAGGFEFDNGRGHVIASLNYASAGSVDRADSRDWFKATKLVGNNDYVEGNGKPRFLVKDGVGNFIGSDAGHTFLTAGPLKGITFAPDGSLLPFDFGTRFSTTKPLSQSTNGDGQLNDFSNQTQLLAAYEKINSFVRASYEISDDLAVYGEFMHGASIGESLSVPYFQFATNLSISRENAFLPAELATKMDDVGKTSVHLGRTNIDFGRSNPYNDRRMTRIVLGADAEISDDWSLAVYYQHGSLDIINEVRNDANRKKYALAADSVLDSNGNAVCRSTLTDPTNGCVASNLFGLGAPSQAAINYVNGTARQNIELTQDVFSLAFSGDLFELPAGSISSAFGYEYRKEKFTAKADDISKENGWWVGNYSDAGGEYDVNEVFAEVLIPIFYDHAFGESLDVSAAARVTDYSTSGQVITWKVGFSYDIGAGVLLRGTQSRDIRAPNMSEYFSGGVTNSLFFIDPEILDASGEKEFYSVPRTISGNKELDPENADTATIGVVYSPEFIEDLQFSLDYFKIEVDDSIITVNHQSIVDRCFEGENEFCNLVERDSTTGRLSKVYLSPVNINKENLAAYDFEVTYNFEVAGGNIDLHSLWTYTTEHYIEDRGVRDSLLGEFSGANGAIAGGPQELTNPHNL